MSACNNTIITFRFLHAIVYVERKTKQLAFLGHFLETVHTGGRFLANVLALYP